MGWWHGRVFYNCVSPKGRLAQQSVEFLPQLCSIFSNDNISVTSKLVDGLNTTVKDTNIIVDDFDTIISTTPSSLPPVSLGGSPAFDIHRTTTKIQKTSLDQMQDKNHRGLRHLVHLATSACGAAAASLSNKIMHAAASDVIHPTTDSDNTTTDSDNIEHEQVSSMFTADPAVDAINFVTTMPDWPHQQSNSKPTSGKEKTSSRPTARNRLIMYNALVGRRATKRRKTIVDSGASKDFISAKTAIRGRFNLTKSDKPLNVALANGKNVISNMIAKDVPITIGNLTITRDLHVLEMTELEVVLGKPFLYDYGPKIDFTTNIMTVEVDGVIHVLDPFEEHYSLDSPSCDIMSHDEAQTVFTSGERLYAAHISTQPAERCPNTLSFSTIDPRSFNLLSITVAQVEDIAAATDSVEDEFLQRWPQPVTDKDNQLDEESHSFLHKYMVKYPELYIEEHGTASRSRKFNDEEVHHRIITEPGAVPPCRQTYRLSPSELRELKKQIDDLLEKGLIRPSSSPYGAPVLFAPKPDGSLRLVLDYRELNAITVKDRYPLPRDSDLFDQLAGAKVVSSVDLLQGFWQTLNRPEDIHKTAIRTPLGAFEFLVMPMGLCNAPATFQRMMENVLRPYLTQFCMCYQDDLIIYSKSAEEHRRHLQLIFNTLREHNLKLKLKKCEFFRKRIKFLGHIIDVTGDYAKIEPNPELVQTIVDWKPLQSNGDVQSFIGAVNYYSRMIENYAERAAPLTSIMNDKWSEAKGTMSEFWTDDCDKAFEDLKKAITTAPVLAINDPELPYVLQTDASDKALGGVLMQIRPDGNRVVIAYLHHKFNKVERRWPIHERELYALYYSLGKYRHYLMGADFIYEGDHKPLAWIRTQKHLSPKQARWLDVLESFNWVFKHIPGKDLTVPDAISRTALQDDIEDIGETGGILSYLMQAAPELATDAHKNQPHLLETLQRVASGLDGAQPHGAEIAALLLSDHHHKMDHTMASLSAMPHGTEDVQPWVKVDPDGRPHPLLPLSASDTPGLVVQHNNTTAVGDLFIVQDWLHQLRLCYANDKLAIEVLGGGEQHGYFVRRGLVMRQTNDNSFPVVYIPDSATKLQHAILAEYHDAAIGGHLSSSKTLEKAQRNFFWVNMKDSVDAYIKSCDSCQRAKRRTTKAAGANVPYPVPDYPFEVIALDMKSGLPSTTAGNNAAWVVIDKLSRRAHVIPCATTCTSAQTARMIFDHVVRHWGVPHRIISDRDPRFIAAFWQELWALVGTNLNMSTAEHPQTDGSSERFIGTLAGMIRAHAHKNPQDWDEYVGALEFAYNDSVNPATGFTPFQLSIGRDPSLPITMMLHGVVQRPALYATDDQFLDPGVYLQRYASTLNTAKQQLRRKQQQQHQQLLERTSYPVTYDAGDYVYMEASRVTPLGTMDERRHGPYRVVRKVGTNSYELDFGAGSRRHNPVNEDRLSPFLDRNTRLPWPEAQPPSERLPSPPEGQLPLQQGPPGSLQPLPQHAPPPSGDQAPPLERAPIRVPPTSYQPAQQFLPASRAEPPPPGTSQAGSRQLITQPSPPPPPKEKTTFKLSTKGFTGLHTVTSWRVTTLKGVDSAEVLASYKSQPTPVWRSLYAVLREGGWRVVRHFIETAAPQHPHLLRVGHKVYGNRTSPFIVTDHDKKDPSWPYRVVYSDSDNEDISAAELTEAELLSNPTATLNHMAPPHIKRRLRILDLCCGTKSITRALHKLFPHAKIVTVDVDPAFNPSILTDVREWKVSHDFKVGHFDMIWASPPCTQYSLAKTIGTRDLQTADSVVTAVLRIIDYLKPKAWFIENPHALLGTRPFMQKLEAYKNTCTYCRYGFKYRKETDIWTNIQVNLRHCETRPCVAKAMYGKHLQTAQAGPTHSGTPGTPREQAYAVPEALLKQLLTAAITQI